LPNRTFVEELKANKLNYLMQDPVDAKTTLKTRLAGILKNDSLVASLNFTKAMPKKFCKYNFKNRINKVG